MIFILTFFLCKINTFYLIFKPQWLVYLPRDLTFNNRSFSTECISCFRVVNRINSSYFAKLY
jgi:hypothetical protein